MPCGCCLLAVAGSIIPRATIIFLWIFTDLVRPDAFNGIILPILGTIFLPFTTLAYVVFYWGADGDITWGWVIIAGAVFLDIGNWASGYWGRGRSVTVPGTSAS